MIACIRNLFKTPKVGETWGIYTPKLFFINDQLICLHAVKSPHKVWIGKIKDTRGLIKVAGTLLEQEYTKQQCSGQTKTLEEFINVHENTPG